MARNARERAEETFMSGEGTGYIIATVHEGENVHLLCDGLGDPIAMSDNGAYWLINWARDHNLPASSVH